MLTSDLAYTLYNQSLYTKQFYLENVYVGMLAAELNADLKALNRHYCYHRNCNNAFEKRINITYFFYLNTLEDFYQAWNRVNKYVPTFL